MKPNFRIFFFVLLVLTVLWITAIPTIGLAFTFSQYNGTCSGFTDGSWSCPWGEFLQNQISYTFIFSLPLLLLIMASWAVTFLFWVVSHFSERFSHQVQYLIERITVIILSLIGLFIVFYSAIMIVPLLITLFIG